MDEDLDPTVDRVVSGLASAVPRAEQVARYLFAESLVRKRRVLDLVSGTGHGASILGRSASALVCLDVSPPASGSAGPGRPARHGGRVAGSVEALPFSAGAFDAVVAFEGLGRVEEGARVLGEVRRVLAPGGILVVSAPGLARHPRGPGERRPLRPGELEVEGLEDLLRAAFPWVRMYLQTQARSVVIAPAGEDGGPPSRKARLADGPASGAEREEVDGGQAIAVCGDAPVATRRLVYLLPRDGGVWRDREGSAGDVQAGPRATPGDRTRGLEAELARAQEDLRRLEAELREARSLLATRAPRWIDGRGAAPGLVRWSAAVTARLTAVGLGALLAPAVGVAALALEGLGRLLPRRQALESLCPFDASRATIQVLNYNGKDLLARNIPHLQAAVARSGVDHEILVVDNGSDDGSVEFLRQAFPEVRVAALPSNRFFSAGNDLGFLQARHDVVVLLNNDMRVEPEFLEPLLRPFAEDRRVFAVASQILMPPGKRQEETGLARGRFLRGRLELRHDPVADDMPPEPVPVLWAGCGACALDRRKVLELGGLDTLYDPFYCEDADISLRAWMRGWRVLFTPASRVWHEHRTTSRRVFGESFVDETTRRNILLLLWANLHEPGMLLEHLLALPRIAYAQARDHGWSGIRSLLRAAWRAPRAVARRLRERGHGPGLREVLQATDWGIDPVGRRPPRSRRGNEPLKVTMVSPYHLYPVQHGGAVRMYQVLRELARRGHDVSLVGFVDTEEQRQAGRHLGEFCGEVRLLVRGAGPARTPGSLVPWPVREFDRPDLRRELAQHLERKDPDVLQVEYTHLAPYASPSPRRVSCLTEHDVAFVSLYRHARVQASRAAAAGYYLEYLRMFRYELAALKAFDVVFTVSAQDAALLRPYLGGSVRVSDRAPIGADVDGLGRVERRPGPPTLLFVGNCAHTPNVDAVTFLAREILPELHRRAPEVRVVIAGAHPPEAIRRLADDPRIQVPGFVPDLAPHYAVATALVSPVRVASGVRVKVLEAFAARVPVVSTSMGAEGIEVVADRHLLIGDTPEAFVDQTLRLLREPELGARLAANARELVERTYGWRAIVDALEEEYRAALWRKLNGGRSP
jgi:GT2 family glycosyltransferase/glycosyltransferase involved in cell wall biosynthesis/SAM-dependent methyltransferase